MASPELIKKYREEYLNSGLANTSDTIAPAERIARWELNKEKTTGQKIFSGISSGLGKFLGVGSELVGAKAGVELAAPIAQVASMPFIGKKGRERVLLGKPIGEITQKAETEGIGSAIKDIAGKSLEVGTSLAPFSKTAAVAFKSAKMSTLARYLGYGTTGGIYGGAFSTANAMQENKKILPELIKGVTTGAILGMAIPAVIEGSVRAIKNVASLYSGVPKGALENAFENPEKVRDAVHKYVKNPEQTREILDNAENALGQIKKTRSQNYEKALSQIQETLPDEGVKEELNKSLNKFSTKTLVKSEQKSVEELNKLINTWDDFTPKGVNELKQAIRNRRLNTNSDYLNKIFGTAESDLRSYIEKVSPQIAEMNSSYADASRFIENLEKEFFGTTGNMKDSTKLNRLLTLFSEKGQLRQELIKELGVRTGNDLLNEITGAALTSWLPTNWVNRFILGGAGLASIGGTFANPLIAGTIPTAIAAASPRIIGKAARVAGQVSRVTPVIGQVALPYGLKAIENYKK